jgi:hypothetical protein
MAGGTHKLTIQFTIVAAWISKSLVTLDYDSCRNAAVHNQCLVDLRPVSWQNELSGRNLT